MVQRPKSWEYNKQNEDTHPNGKTYVNKGNVANVEKQLPNQVRKTESKQ